MIPGVSVLARRGEGVGGGRFEARFEDVPAEDDRVDLLLGRPNGDDRARLVTWARALGEVSHPSLPAILRIDDETLPGYVAFEQIDGAPLAARLAQKGSGLTEVEALAVTLQTAGALEACHRAGLTHGAVDAEVIILAERAGGLDEVFLTGWSPPASDDDFEARRTADIRALGGILYLTLTGMAAPSTKPCEDEELEGDGGRFDGVLLDWVEVGRDLRGMGEPALQALADSESMGDVGAFARALLPHFRARMGETVDEVGQTLDAERAFMAEVEGQRARLRDLENQQRFIRGWLMERAQQIAEREALEAELTARVTGLQTLETEIAILVGTDDGVALPPAPVNVSDPESDLLPGMTPEDLLHLAPAGDQSEAPAGALAVGPASVGPSRLHAPLDSLEGVARDEGAAVEGAPGEDVAAESREAEGEELEPETAPSQATSAVDAERAEMDTPVEDTGPPVAVRPSTVPPPLPPPPEVASALPEEQPDPLVADSPAAFAPSAPSERGTNRRLLFLILAAVFVGVGSAALLLYEPHAPQPLVRGGAIIPVPPASSPKSPTSLAVVPTSAMGPGTPSRGLSPPPAPMSPPALAVAMVTAPDAGIAADTALAASVPALAAPPPGMVAVPAGPVLPGLADAQRAAVIAWCQKALKKYPEDLCGSLVVDEPRDEAVVVEGFYLDRFEVSQDEFNACAIIGRCRRRSQLRWEDGRQPATGVTRALAVEFCRWKDKRLPTATEWLRAARGDGERIFPWGDALPAVGDDSQANYGRFSRTGGAPAREDRHKYAGPVQIFSEVASPFGAANLAGNVAEWTLSDVGDQVVVAGGGWRSAPFQLRVTRTERVAPDLLRDDIGFRCARDGRKN